MGNKLPVFPMVAVGRTAIDGFAEFSADGDGGLDAVGDFFAFPMRKRCHHREEQPAGRRAGINALLQGNHVGVVDAEVIGKILQLAFVAREARQFGKDEAGDVSALHVGEHPFGFGMFLHGPAADAREVIDLLDRPALHDGAMAGLRAPRGTLGLGLGTTHLSGAVRGQARLKAGRIYPSTRS